MLDDVVSEAIVGATDERFSTYSLIRNLRHFGFSGDIWPSGRSADQIYGLTRHEGLSHDEYAGRPIQRLSPVGSI